MLQINKDYPCNPSNYTVMTDKTNKYIVIHYVGALGSALQNVRYFMNNSGLKASAHYFVGHKSENGAIYQSVLDKDTAWHCGTTGAYVHPFCRNSNSIGIEMCCHNNGKWYFDDITVENTIALTKELMQKYNIPIENVIRHYDVTGKNCPAPYVENPVAWEEFKSKLVEVEEMRYNKIEEMPDWAKPIIQKLMNKGIIKGDENGNLDLSLDMIRMLIFNDRAGVYK